MLMENCAISAGKHLDCGQKLSLRQVIADHRAVKFREEFATEWAVALLYRPAALLIAWLLQGSRVTPAGLTLAGFLCLPAMAAAAAVMPPGTAILPVVALAVVFMILDCADGTLARITRRTSLPGQYADFASDLCYRVVFYGATGWVMQAHPVLAGSWLATLGFPLALAAAWMMTFARLCRVYAELRFPEPRHSRPDTSSAMAGLAGFVSGLDGLAPLLAAAAWVSGAPAAFLAWIFCYALLDLAHTQSGIIAKLRQARP